MSRAFDIASAVVQELNAQFAGQFAAVLRALPGRTVEELADLCVTVSPRSIDWQPASRAGAQRTVAVDVGIQQRVSADLDQDVQTLADLAEDIIEHMWGRVPPGLTGVAFVSAANDPIVNVEQLQQTRVFTGLVTLRYRC